MYTDIDFVRVDLMGVDLVGVDLVRVDLSSDASSTLALYSLVACLQLALLTPSLGQLELRAYGHNWSQCEQLYTRSTNHTHFSTYD